MEITLLTDSACRIKYKILDIELGLPQKALSRSLVGLADKSSQMDNSKEGNGMEETEFCS